MGGCVGVGVIVGLWMRVQVGDGCGFVGLSLHGGRGLQSAVPPGWGLS